MNILTCLKNQRSILKIKNNYNDLNFENIKEFEELQEKIIFSNWDIAIIDNKNFIDDTQTKEVVNLLENKDVKVLVFDGDFEALFEQIDSILNELKKEEEAENEKNVKVNVPIKYIEKEVEIIKEVKIKEYKHMYSEIESKTVGIMNLSRGAGSTFITLNLAKALAEYKILTAVIELPLEAPKIYTNIGIEQKLSEDDENGYLNFFSFPHAINNNEKIEKDKETYIDDIIFVVPDPHKENIKGEDWNFNKMLKLLNVARKAKVHLIDINNSFEHESVRDLLLEELDLLMVIIDPNPTEVILNISRLNEIKKLEKENRLNVKYIINKNNSGVKLKELKRYIEVDILTSIPFIDNSLVYNALYEGEIPYRYEDIKEKLNQSFVPILRELIPLDLIKENVNKNKNTTKKIFNLFRKK